MSLQWQPLPVYTDGFEVLIMISARIDSFESQANGRRLQQSPQSTHDQLYSVKSNRV